MGDEDGAICLLVVFQEGNDGSTDGQTGAVQGMDEARFHLLLASRPVADIGSPGLKIFEVGAGGDLSIDLLSGQPDLNVIALGRRETDIAGT